MIRSGIFVPGPEAFDDRPPLILPSDKIITPTDDRGIVLEDELVREILQVVPEGHQWGQERDVHHLYWPFRWFPNLRDRDPVSNPRAFREMPYNKLRLPLDFHTLVHQITEPPKVPKKEVRRYRVAAWEVARSLFAGASIVVDAHTKQLQQAEYDREGRYFREGRVDEAAMNRVNDIYFRTLEAQLDSMLEIPGEFMDFDPAEVIDNPDPEAVHGQLIQLVVPRSVSLKRVPDVPDTLAS